jgi:hypothetical protein
VGWGLAGFLLIAGPPWWAWTQHVWWGYVLAVVLGVVWTIPLTVMVGVWAVERLREA